ncbi:DUF362 domain-containing protein [Clostridium oryzae]|uniref:DUF362 domain-containing protein n=1 Tax=Clostridium oryzae TaxID=1450648 RepID=A0A1V4IEU6_9CLOT|nr:DUF362 domain-containing protein [Clostridium oryzae]OPJ58057.1 hypothetical protein CLORY_37990 [Clostridium oryzae]
MILSAKNKKELFCCLDKIGIKSAINKNKYVLIKINLARPAEPGHPRTDVKLLSKVIEYVYLNGGDCTLAESANGYLRNNLKQAGLGEILSKYKVKLIDLDFEEVDEIDIDGEKHFLPKCLKNYGVRIGLPATSKRPEAIFSNNVKLFIGAVPRRMYQIGDLIKDWRPRIHIHLHKSVANVYRAIQEYCPFDFYINGGVAMEEYTGQFEFEQTFIGDDAIELDMYMLDNFFKRHEVPEYLQILRIAD